VIELSEFYLFLVVAACFAAFIVITNKVKKPKED
jgi:hypothetical protein